eukprot:11191899-Lingulodinium_polyedra.AAC.1
MPAQLRRKNESPETAPSIHRCGRRHECGFAGGTLACCARCQVALRSLRAERPDARSDARQGQRPLP